ncbi:MAG: class I SAM-dependent methyltransferase [Promethearchaeota archaeon]
MEFQEAKVKLGKKFSYHAEFLWDLVESLQLKKDARILDVGTGRGFMAIILALQGYNVITGEPEGDNWNNWQESALKVNVLDKIKFKHFNAEQLPFENREFDAVFIYASFHHIKGKYTAFKEFKRVVNKDGIVVIIELTAKGVEQIRKKHHSHPEAINTLEFSKDSLIKVEIKESEFVNAFIFRKYD